MTKLSPAAQVVYEAAWAAYWPKDAEHPADAELIAAAALRAAALYCKREALALYLEEIADELEARQSDHLGGLPANNSPHPS